MPASDFLNPLRQFLTDRYPQPTALWNFSENNCLNADWLLATPTDVWGKSYAEFKQAVPGDGGFGLKTCTGATLPTEQCETVQASVSTPGAAPQKLLVGHSYKLFEALYEVMTAAEVFLDFATLTPPTGRFLDAFRNALTFLSNRPEDRRPVIRILFSNPLPNFPPLTALPFLESITEQLDPTRKMEIYITVMSSSFSSWNHAKIVAADGVRALVGGHNMWGPHYLEKNPVFDVSMKLTGSAALHAQDYADNLWAYEQWRAQHLVRWIVGYDPNQELNLHAAYRFDSRIGRCLASPGVLPPASLYQSARSRFPAPPADATAKVLAVGRGGNTRASYLFPTLYSYVLPFTEPSDEAVIQLIGQATTSVRMSLQSFQLGPLGIIAGWNNELFQQLARAMQRGVSVQAVLSNPKAVAGGLTPLSAPYEGEDPSAINEWMLQTLVAGLKLSDADARRLISQRFRIASFRYSSEASYPGDAPIPNHAKTLIVDDAVFYIGSQNQYRSNLNEFGYIVEDAAAAQDYVARYWAPLWNAAAATVVQAFDQDYEVSQEVEAMQFILGLDQNSRVALIWSYLMDRLGSETDPSELALTQEMMDDLIVNGGFGTTLAKVLEGLKTPFFTETPPAVQPSPEALRFITNLMDSPDLMQDFSAVVQAPSASVEESNRKISDFLQARGYKCTALEVLSAFLEMRKKVLSYWAGNYTTWITPDGGASYTLNATGKRRVRALRAARRQGVAADVAEEEILPVLGPLLVIAAEGDVSLDGVKILAPIYDNNVLSWTAGSDGSGNATSATLHFGNVTRATINDSFEGRECFGTITYPEGGTAPRAGVCSFYARIVDPAPPDPNPSDKKSYTVFYVLGALALAALLGALAYFTFRNRSRAFEYQRIGREKRASELDEGYSLDELEPVTSPGRQTEVNLLVASRLRQRVRLQQETLEELARYEGAMGQGQRMRLAESAGELRDAATALRDLPASSIDAVVTTQRTNLQSIQTGIDRLASDIDSVMSEDSQGLIRDNTELGARIVRETDSYLEDRDEDLPIEEPEL